MSMPLLESCCCACGIIIDNRSFIFHGISQDSTLPSDRIHYLCLNCINCPACSEVDSMDVEGNSSRKWSVIQISRRDAYEVPYMLRARNIALTVTAVILAVGSTFAVLIASNTLELKWNG